jgi:hypothetical protein
MVVMMHGYHRWWWLVILGVSPVVGGDVRRPTNLTLRANGKVREHEHQDMLGYE